MAEENQAVDLDGKSLEELEQLEDAIVADSGEDQGRDDDPVKPPPALDGKTPDKPTDPPADPPKPDADPADPPLPAEAKGEGDDAGDDPPLPPIEDQQPAAGDPEPPKTDAEIRQHTSPPSKWAKMRHKQTALQADLSEATAKAEKADHLEEELTKLRQDMAWMKSAMAGRDVKLPEDPTKALSDERLSEIQDEFGAEMADSFRAVRALLGDKAQQPAPEQKAGEQPAAQGTDQPAQVQPGDQPEDPEVAAIRTAMESNDHLMFWAEEKPELLQRAVDVDAAWLKHPSYLNLPYDKRFNLVVKQVQDEEVAKHGALAEQKKEGDVNEDVPASLSGSGGSAPPQGSMTPTDRVLAAPTPEKQEEIYQTLTEPERDQVDLDLGI